MATYTLNELQELLQNNPNPRNIGNPDEVNVNPPLIEPGQTAVPLKKKVLGAQTLRNNLDLNFKELLTKKFSIKDFFILYKQLFYDIPLKGIFSHEKIIQKSRPYIGGYIHPKSKDINILYSQIKKAIEKYHSIEENHSLISNNTLIVSKGPNQQHYYIQSYKKRQIFGSSSMISRLKEFNGFPKNADIAVHLDPEAIESIPSGPPIYRVEDINVSPLLINQGIEGYSIEELINAYGSITIEFDTGDDSTTTVSYDGIQEDRT